MTRIAELQDRLRRLAKRREGEGIYTDAAICEEAAESLSRTGAVKVKALEWEDREERRLGATTEKFWRAQTAFDWGYRVKSYGKGFSFGDAESYPTVDAAKAAAQADYERRILSALEPAAPEAIAKGLLSDADAKAAKLGKFGHHPDPAIDFEIEVETLQARLIDAKGGISKPGTEPEAVAAVLEDIERAMTFRVGGDPSAVRAKQTLRDLEADAKQAGQPAAPEGHQDDEPVAWQWRAYEDGGAVTDWHNWDWGDRRGWEALAKRDPGKYEVRSRPLYTRPAEQAVTYSDEAMLEMASDAYRRGVDRSSFAQAAEWAFDEAKDDALTAALAQKEGGR